MTSPVAKTTMLIRSTIAEAFDAFCNPEKITQFWLNAASGPLAKDAVVNWSFMVPGATEIVQVTEFRESEQISFVWSDGVKATIAFQEFDSESVRISVEATGFTAGKEIEDAINATEGFTIVLCDLKTLLESGRSANLVKDKAALIGASLNNSQSNA